MSIDMASSADKVNKDNQNDIKPNQTQKYQVKDKVKLNKANVKGDDCSNDSKSLSSLPKKNKKLDFCSNNQKNELENRNENENLTEEIPDNKRDSSDSNLIKEMNEINISSDNSKETKENIPEDFHIPEQNSKKINQMIFRSSICSNENKTTSCSSDINQRNFDLSKGSNNTKDKIKFLVKRGRSKTKKTRKFDKDLLRQYTMRMCKDSLNEIFKRLTKKLENQKKIKRKKYWKLVIANNIISSKSNLIKFYSQTVKEIYRDTKEKSYTDESFERNRKKINNLYKKASEEENDSDFKNLKILFDLKFIDVLKIYYNGIKEKSSEKEKLFNEYEFEYYKDHFDEKAEGNDVSEKRRKAIEDFINEVDKNNNECKIVKIDN